MARGRKANPVVYSARAPGSTSSKGLGYHEGLEYGGGDVTFGRTTSYDGLNKYFREYKRDAIVRAAVNIKAEWITKEGFETKLEEATPVPPPKQAQVPPPPSEHLPRELPIEQPPPEQEQLSSPELPVPEEPPHSDIKDFIDEVNRKVNFDAVLRSSVVSMCVDGTATWFIVREDKTPVKLLELEPWNMTPYVDSKTGELDYWKYQGTKWVIETEMGQGKLPPEDVLFFTKDAVYGEYVGLSEIEPVIDTLETRRYLYQEAIKETAKSLWAPVGILKFDTGRMDETKAGALIKKYVDKAVLAPGKFIGVNQDVEFVKIDISPDLDKIITALRNIDLEIIGNFQVPCQLLNRGIKEGLSIGSTESEVAAKMFLNGPIADIQRQLARQIEERWYTPLIRLKLGTKEEEKPPVKVKHMWNSLKISEKHEPPKELAPSPVEEGPPALGEAKKMEFEEKRLNLLAEALGKVK